MGHADGMYVALLVGAVVASLAWRWPAVKDWAERVAWRPYREAGLLVGLLLLAFCVVSLLTNNSPWPATVVVPVTVWLIFCAPPPVRKFAPVAMVVAGIVGVALTVSRAGSPALDGGPGQWAASVATRYASWRTALLLESVVFLALGCWLIWRARPAAAASLRPPRWGLLLPLAVAGVGLLVNQQEGHAAAGHRSGARRRRAAHSDPVPHGVGGPGGHRGHRARIVLPDRRRDAAARSCRRPDRHPGCYAASRHVWRRRPAARHAGRGGVRGDPGARGLAGAAHYRRARQGAARPGGRRRAGRPGGAADPDPGRRGGHRRRGTAPGGAGPARRARRPGWSRWA